MLLKKLGLLCISLFSAGTFAVNFNDTAEGLEIGSEAPLVNKKMTATDGNAYALADLKKDRGLLVIFSCNSCPFVVGRGDSEGWEGRYNGLAKHAQVANVGMVLVNSNAAKRTGDDSLSEMVKRAEEQAYAMAYVVDEKSELADAFGAKTTPHVYLFDADMKLVYKGAIDDNNASAKEVKSHYLKTALKEMAADRPISEPETRPLGCSIKRK